MTVIAWDGRVLAADCRATTGGSHFATRKVYRVDDHHLVGFSGNPGRIPAFLAWLRAGAVPADYPPNPKADLYALVVHSNGTLVTYEEASGAIPVMEKQFAIGSGREYARTAMYFGANAVEAVNVAIQFDECCGNGVDVLSFGGARFGLDVEPQAPRQMRPWRAEAP